MFCRRFFQDFLPGIPHFILILQRASRLRKIRKKPCEAVSRNAYCPGRAPLAGQHVIIVFLLINPGGLVELGEIEQRNQFLSLVIAADTEDMVIPGFDDPRVGFGLEHLIALPHHCQAADRLKENSLPRRGVVSKRRLIPVEISAMQISRIICLQGILVVAVIIELSDLITTVQHRNAALRKQKCVQHDIQTDCLRQFVFILLILSGFDPAQGRRRTAKTRVTKARIVIIELASGITAVPCTTQIVIQIFLVRDFLDAELFQEIIVKAPADIIVAAQIIEEHILFGQRKNDPQLMLQQPYIPRRNGMPRARHRRYVIQHMTFRLLYRSKVRDNLGRLHNHFSEKQCSGADNFAGHSHNADQRMDLRKIAAGRSQCLPDIRHRVKTDNIHAVVAQVQHVRGHVVENCRVPVVQVPLIRIKRRHNHLMRFFAPGEISGRRLRKYLRNRLLELIRNIPVVEEEIPVLKLLLSGSGSSGPLMIFAGMVHDEIQADTHAFFMAFIRKIRKILHRPQLRLHLPEIRNGVAAVASAGRALQEGHQVNIVQAAFLDIIQM